MKIKWNAVTWYTRLVSYLLLFVIFFLGFYFGGRFQDLRQITSAPAQVQVPKVYKNTDLGFQITFPINWSNVVIRKNKKLDSVDFSLMHSLGGYVKVFSIRRFTQDEWKGAQNSFYPTIKIADSGDYVFAYILGTDDEGFEGFSDVVYGTPYQGPYYDVQTNIIPTFNLI